MLACLAGSLAFLALLDWRTARAGPRADLHRYHERRFAVSRVIDGDTFELAVHDGRQGRTRVRLWGVDAPELAHGDQPAMHGAERAAAYVREHLEGRSVVIVLSPDQTRDRHGRLLAYVLEATGADSFNERLVREGMAYADTRFPHPHEARFLAAERRARRESVGLWAGLTSEQEPDWRRRPGRAENGQDDPK